MKISIANKEFKKRFGQVNHLLITTLIGLDGIESGIITKKPSSFSTSWNPKSCMRSAQRSRVFILKSFLGWAVESLEMYLTELNRKPKLIESEKLIKLYDKAGQSILRKTLSIADEIKVDPVLIALMDVMITWRNHTFHYDVDNKIRESSFTILKDNKSRLREDFAGLEIEFLNRTWDTCENFTFKETASLISATQKFVQEIDKYVLIHLNHERFYWEMILKYFKKNKKSKEKYLSFESKRKLKFLKILLQNIAGVYDIEDKLLKSLSEKDKDDEK